MVQTTPVEVPPARRLSPRREQTRERLMAAALTVFASRGIIGASVEEICEAAGFTRGAFYSNFADKEDLVVALLRHELEIQFAAAAHAIATMKEQAGGGLGPETLISLALSTFEIAGENGRYGTLTRQELLLHAAREPRVRVAFAEFNQACLLQINELIADALRVARLEFTVDFADAMQLIIATHNQAQLDGLFHDGPVDTRALRVLVLAITRPARA